MKLAQSHEKIDGNALTAAVDEIIDDFGGDARAAVRSLLITNAFLEMARDKALALVSRGYTRGGIDLGN